MKMILILLFLLDFWLCIFKFGKCKELTKELSEKLMPVACLPDRWWDCWVSEDEKK